MPLFPKACPVLQLWYVGLANRTARFELHSKHEESFCRYKAHLLHFFSCNLENNHCSVADKVHVVKGMPVETQPRRTPVQSSYRGHTGLQRRGYSGNRINGFRNHPWVRDFVATPRHKLRWYPF